MSMCANRFKRVVTVEWWDGESTHGRYVGTAPLDGCGLLPLVARAGAIAYATASEGGMYALVRVSPEGKLGTGRVVYRAR